MSSESYRKLEGGLCNLGELARLVRVRAVAAELEGDGDTLVDLEHWVSAAVSDLGTALEPDPADVVELSANPTDAEVQASLESKRELGKGCRFEESEHGEMFPVCTACVSHDPEVAAATTLRETRGGICNICGEDDPE